MDKELRQVLWSVGVTLNFIACGLNIGSLMYNQGTYLIVLTAITLFGGGWSLVNLIETSSK